MSTPRKYAVRNLRLCTKDCICLFVCPYGATDTENSVIDVDKCVGCGACAEACPAGAISLVPKEYPPQQVKTEAVIAVLRQLVSSKAEQERMAAALPGPLAKALEKSNRIMAEDLLRESGFMLPQSGEVFQVLVDMADRVQEPGFPVKDLELLLRTISFHDPAE